MSIEQDLQLEQLRIKDDTDMVVDLEGISLTLMRGIPVKGYQIYSEEDLCWCKRSILDGSTTFSKDSKRFDLYCLECPGHEGDCWYEPNRYSK